MNKKSKLTHSENFLYDFIKKNKELIPTTTITELSDMANVSTATIVRTLKKLGYSGYSSFRFHISNKNEKDNFSILDEVDNDIGNAILKNKKEVNNTIEMLDSKNIEDAIQIIKDSKKILIFARGFSTFVGKEMRTKLQLVDKYCELHTDPNIIRKLSTRVKDNCVVIFISLNGETVELVEAAKNIEILNVPSILITTNADSSLSNITNINFVGYQSSVSFFPDYEIRSRLSLQTIARILLDAYVIRT